MGIYWWNALYFGRLLSRESHARLMNNRLVQGLAAAELDRFLSREPVDVDNGYRVPHLPGHFKKVGWIDPVLEPHELEAGEVQWAEVEKVANPWAETVKSEELDLLKRLIRAAAPEGSPEDKLKPGWYIYQGQWCSYDVESAHKICTEANIRVVGCPLSVYNDA